MHVNMESVNANDRLSFPQCPASCPLPEHVITSQCDPSHLGSLNGPIGDPCQSQAASLPMQLYYAAEAQKGLDLPGNFASVNTIQAACSEHLLEYETPLVQQNSSEAPSYPYNSLENASYALSLTLSGGSDKSLCDGHGGESKRINPVDGNPGDPHKPPVSINKKEKSSGENGKSQDGVRRRARRQRPFRTFGERSSQFRGVSRYRYTGRYEAFLWDNTDPEGKAKTVYVGVFDEEEEAARAYDLAALKFWGRSTPTNFPISDYENDLEEMQNMTKKEYLLSIRRKSKCFSKGASVYRGVSRNTDYTKWQARVGRGHGLRGIYLGTFDTEEEAARAYDIALIRFKGMKAVTNFDLSHYDVRSILGSNTLPIGKGASRLLKKTSVNDVISRRRKDTNAPMLGFQKGSSSIFQPHTQMKSFEHFETETTTQQNQDVSFYQDFRHATRVVHQNPSPSLLHGYQNPNFEANSTLNGLTRNGDGMEANENLSNGGFAGNEHLAMSAENDKNSTGGFPMRIGQTQPCEHFQTLPDPQNQNFQFHQDCNDTNLVLHQNPSCSYLHGYQNPKFQTNPTFLHGLTSIASGVAANENLSGSFDEALSSKGISEKNLMVTNENPYNGIWGGFQEMQTFQRLQTHPEPQNQNFDQCHQDCNDTNQVLHQNPSCSLCHGYQNPKVHQMNATLLFHELPSIGSGMETNESLSKGFSEKRLEMRETDENSKGGIWKGVQPMQPFEQFQILPDQQNQNSTIVESQVNSTTVRSGFLHNGLAMGESSARENADGGGWPEGFGPNEETINSPSSWLENFFRDADPPSFIL